ncbi:MAG: deoxyribodipyrimidine photo-lyase [Flavobacteriaceae bacterium]|nr:deoxyribodipyrimidine photo-lyase [Flavobacteriaceae bacterium]
MKDKISIFWFRRDLRLNDNTGLFHSLNENSKVLPLFIYDTNIISQLKNNDHRLHFINTSINKMNHLLKKENKFIYKLKGDPLDVFKSLLKNFNIEKVYTNRDYTPYAIKRDSKIKKLLNDNDIEFNDYKDHVLFEKNEITKDDGSPYKVYTPYSRKWISRMIEQGIDEYKSENLTKNFIDLSIGLDSDTVNLQKNNINFLKVDTSSNLIDQYEFIRNFPSKDGTSKVGVELRFGTISTRKLIKKAYESNNKTYLKELIWREFFQQILYHFPKTVTNSFKPLYDRIEWINNEGDFKKWCDGETGYPLVDAGMRELNNTGFMHNRVRMLVGSFLCKHLLIDWRWGEAYFREKLFDYETASNVGNWQWVAGCGVDAAPYFRIFNPSEQLKKFDKELKYTKKWVPELNSDKYVEPIVEHKFARERCLLTYKKALGK